MEANHRLVSIANYSLSSLTIGEGSFSKVKVARHKVLQKNVAIKLIKKSSIKDPYVLKNLEREAKILGTLQHNNVVRLVDNNSLTVESELIFYYNCFLSFLLLFFLNFLL